MNKEFVDKIITLRGDVGRKWLDSLPETIKVYEQKWGISVLPPFHLSYNYVAPAKTSDGQNAVLKISFPQNSEFIYEMEALKFFSGEGAVKVLQEDRENQAMLLEKAEPGEGVRSISSEDMRIATVSAVLKKLHKPVTGETAHLFPSIIDWGKAFDRYKFKFPGSSGPVPKELFDKAEGIFNEYGQDIKNPVLLHGDLHADNILSSKRGWLIIDPKGVLGEPEFELGAYLRSPIYDFPDASSRKKLVAERIRQFSEELGFDKEKILNWAIACAVISLLWFLEDEGRFDDVYLQNAQLLSEIRF